MGVKGSLQVYRSRDILVRKAPGELHYYIDALLNEERGQTDLTKYQLIQDLLFSHPRIKAIKNKLK